MFVLFYMYFIFTVSHYIGMSILLILNNIDCFKYS